MPDAEVMVVGEAPGAAEEAQGRPFAGRNGKLLDTYLDVIGLRRDKNIYMTTIVKCRPPQTRDPLPEEHINCRNFWLRTQFKIIRPKIIICVGSVVSQFLIRENMPITRDRSVFVKKERYIFCGSHSSGGALESFRVETGSFHRLHKNPRKGRRNM